MIEILLIIWSILNCIVLILMFIQHKNTKAERLQSSNFKEYRTHNIFKNKRMKLDREKIKEVP